MMHCSPSPINGVCWYSSSDLCWLPNAEKELLNLFNHHQRSIDEEANNNNNKDTASQDKRKRLEEASTSSPSSFCISKETMPEVTALLHQCSPAPFPEHRSTGIDYTSFRSYSSSSSLSNHHHDNNGAPIIPVGSTYADALSLVWRTATVPRYADPNSSSSKNNKHVEDEYDEDDYDLDDSYILDCIEEGSGPAMAPPVPLPYMIDLLTPQWEDEGLYEIAQHREMAAAAAAAKKKKQQQR